MGFATPWLAGWIYDTTGSYAWVVIPSGVATAVAGLIMWYLPSRRPGHPALDSRPDN
jgi:hypothetical protein